jgi:hypothetical protein
VTIRVPLASRVRAACPRHRARGSSSWPFGPLATLAALPAAIVRMRPMPHAAQSPVPPAGSVGRRVRAPVVVRARPVGKATALAQAIGTDLGDTGANFDDLLSGDGALADETTIVYALDRAYADLVRMCAGTTPTGLLPPSGGPVALAARWLTTQDAINERAVTIDRGGCAPARSEHNVIATTAK